MDQAPAKPWNPDRRWADPLIALLLLMAGLGIWGALAARRAPRPAPQRPGLQARAAELGAAARVLFPAPLTAPALPTAVARNPWDEAVLAILAAEQGQTDRGRRLIQTEDGLPGERGAAFRRCWRAAFEQGPPPQSSDLDTLREPLGAGYAYLRLQARLAENPEALQKLARTWAGPRLILLGLGGFAALGLGLVGLGCATFLLLSPRGPRPSLPHREIAMPWRALALALLGWFVAFQLSGTVAALLLGALQLPKILGLPIAYSFHAAVGTLLLLRAEGIGLREAWHRATPGSAPRALAWALAFLGIALAANFLVGLLASPLLRGAEAPQGELREMIATLHNPLAIGLVLATLAGLAPLFEEWVFRGVLLPWLAPRLGARHGQRLGWGLAILISGLGFGAIHLQPTGLPSLAALGVVLGWAFYRTGNLWTAVAVHACWNGGGFLLMRALA